MLKSMLDQFGNNPFMFHQTNCFPAFTIHNAYEAEETAFKGTVKTVDIHAVANDANGTSSHTIHKFKVGDYISIALKAIILPHVNEYDLHGDFFSDCVMHIPVGMRVLVSAAALFLWPLHKINLKSAMLQSVSGARDVYVILPRESADRGKFLCLLFATTYILFNTNSKLQALSEELMLSIVFEPAPLMPQLFIMRSCGHMISLATKIVGDILVTGLKYIIPDIVHNIDARFPLGRVLYGPGTMRFFGINLFQNIYMTVVVNADDKLNGLASMYIS